MRKMGKLMMATLMMAAAGGMAPGLYDTGIGEDTWKNESDEERKRRMFKKTLEQLVKNFDKEWNRRRTAYINRHGRDCV